MKYVIFYCHGLGSNKNSDKVDLLKKHFPEDYVLSCDIPTNPLKGLLEIERELIHFYEQNSDCIGKLGHIFIGTSLGAWFASAMCHMVVGKSNAICINPSYDPSTSLKKYANLDKNEIKLYNHIIITDKVNFIFANQDEVIDFKPFIDKYKHDMNYVCVDGDHRFTGHLFENHVVPLIKNLKINTLSTGEE